MFVLLLPLFRLRSDPHLGVGRQRQCAPVRADAGAGHPAREQSREHHRVCQGGAGPGLGAQRPSQLPPCQSKLPRHFPSHQESYRINYLLVKVSYSVNYLLIKVSYCFNYLLVKASYRLNYLPIKVSYHVNYRLVKVSLARHRKFSQYYYSKRNVGFSA